MIKSSRSHNMFQDGDWEAGRLCRLGRRDERLMAPPRHAAAPSVRPCPPPSHTLHDIQRHCSFTLLADHTTPLPHGKHSPSYHHQVAESILQSVVDRPWWRRQCVVQIITQVPMKLPPTDELRVHRSTGTGPLDWLTAQETSSSYLQ